MVTHEFHSETIADCLVRECMKPEIHARFQYVIAQALFDQLTTSRFAEFGLKLQEVFVSMRASNALDKSSVFISNIAAPANAILVQ